MAAVTRRPKVDRDKCIGAAACESVCPEVFKVDAEGKATVMSGIDYEKYKDKIADAIEMCPVAAIAWEEHVEEQPTAEKKP